MAQIPPDPIYTFRKNMAQINCLLAVLLDHKEFLYVGTVQGYVHIWDLETKRELKYIKACNEACLAILQHKNHFLTQEKGACLKYWRVLNDDWTCEHVIKFSYGGFCNILVTDNEVYCPNDNGVVTTFKNHKKTITCDSSESGEVMCMKFLECSASLLVAYESGRLSLWRFNEGLAKIECEIKFADTPMCIDFCELSREGVLGSSGETLNKFCVDNNNTIKATCSSGLTNPGIATVKINKDGKLLVAGCWDSRIRYFSMKHLKLLAVLEHHGEGPIQSVIFSDKTLPSFPAGTVFAAGCDGRISVWDLYTSKALNLKYNN